MHTALQKRRRGSVLIIVLIVLFALVGLVLAMGRTAHTDSALAANNRGTHQADAIERGAEQYVIALLTDYRDSLSTLTDKDFAQVAVGDGFFWISRPNYNDKNLPTYGLLDESSKLNLNTASQDTLGGLEGMTDQIAGAIVDWRDTDDTVSTNGAESPDYMSLKDSYRAKNADFEAVEEMLLLKGMKRDLFYGTGQPGRQARAFENNYYQTNGVRDFFTVWSTRKATAADGSQRVSLRPTDDDGRRALNRMLADKLGQSRADAIYPVRRGNPPITFEDLFDMAQKRGLNVDEIEKIENFITYPGATRGQININTAPREVLLSLVPPVSVLPGASLSTSDIDSLIARRSTNAATDTPSIAWVYDVLKEKSVGLGRFICAQGDAYSADIVAVGRGGRAFKHVRIVVDASQTPPRIVYRRDLTDQGWPLDAQILASIKSGMTPSMTVSSSIGGMR